MPDSAWTGAARSVAGATRVTWPRVGPRTASTPMIRWKLVGRNAAARIADGSTPLTDSIVRAQIVVVSLFHSQEVRMSKNPKQTRNIVFAILGTIGVVAIFAVADPLLKVLLALAVVLGGYLAYSKDWS